MFKIKMRVENWLALTSLVFFVLFVGQIISLEYLLIDDQHPDLFTQNFIDSKLFMFYSIGAGPAGILAAVPFIMTKTYGSKPTGMIIVAGGAILLVGMLASYFILDSINDDYVTDYLQLTPILFIILSIPAIVVGAYLMKEKKKRPKKEFF
ncbi:hypothetical protein [Nitrosopumilus sp. b3]|uniref:hypothetical protein n=1 Tax=Nitrosopumilus sp. b3 TaxID=2109909 RepID=UPI00210703DF|nr:hypothetical protein [Nitrosopumilus sp. b3]